MNAVVVKVTISDPEPAQAALHDTVVPRVSGAPGFVAGHWVALADGKGTSLLIFESEDAARTVAGMIESDSGNPGVTIDSVEVGEVVAHA